MKIWNELTKVNGKYVGKDVNKTLCFFVGLFICICSAFAPVFNKTMDTTVGVILLSFAFGMQGYKGFELYQNRKLDVAATTGEPVMSAGDGSDTPTVTATASVS